ncbi:MAG: hypothetical protein IKG21_09110 [Atopobiaceae bacterium]|nr:hypothetical protein [Atopobiaceae bacterium]
MLKPKDRLAAKAARRDLNDITKTVYRRAMANEDTTVADIAGQVFLMTRYSGCITTSAEDAKDEMSKAKVYARSLLRQVAMEHPTMAERIHFS